MQTPADVLRNIPVYSDLTRELIALPLVDRFYDDMDAQDELSAIETFREIAAYLDDEERELLEQDVVNWPDVLKQDFAREADPKKIVQDHCVFWYNRYRTLILEFQHDDKELPWMKMLYSLRYLAFIGYAGEKEH